MIISKYARPAKEEVFVLAEEPAREQVMDLLDYYDIDMTPSSDKGALTVEKSLDFLTNCVRRGTLEVKRNEKGKMEVVHLLSTGDTLTYKEINSQAKLAMEKFDQDATYSRVYAFMGSLCGLGKAAIEKLGPKDLTVVENLGTLFIIA